MYNILILCNGQGKRFSDDNYLFPKPLVNVFGKPIISHILNNLKNIKNVRLNVVYNHRLEKFQFEEKVSFDHPDLEISFLSMRDTCGPAETIYEAIKILNIEGPFLSIDCDITFSSETIDKIVNNSRNEIAYFIDSGDLPQFSYMEHENGLVKKIVEKQKISNFASCGIYSFSDSYHFQNSFENLTTSNIEVCPSDIYTYLLQEGKPVYCIECSDYFCLGTPRLLNEYCVSRKTSHKKRFCFDIDNTLIKLNKQKDYRNVEIIPENVNLLRSLYKDGHYIILHTSRNMKTFNNNLGEINKNTAPILFETLNKHDIPYHEIYFGKPVADFYIDDLAVNSFTNIQKHIGFYYENS